VVILLYQKVSALALFILHHYTDLTTDEILEPELTKTKRGKLRLTWNPIEDAAKYQILTSAKYSADKYEVQFETEKTSYLNSAYSFDEIKYYRIRAVHNDGMLGKMSRIIKVDPEQFQD